MTPAAEILRGIRAQRAGSVDGHRAGAILGIDHSAHPQLADRKAAAAGEVVDAGAAPLADEELVADIIREPGLQQTCALVDLTTHAGSVTDNDIIRVG